MITWAWKKPLHPAKSTAGRTTARRRCASTAVTMAPAIIARAIGYTAHAGARRRQIRSKGNIIAITAAGRTPPQMLLREPPCRSDKERHGHRYMAPCYGGCKSRNQSKSQKMSEFSSTITFHERVLLVAAQKPTLVDRCREGTCSSCFL